MTDRLSAFDVILPDPIPHKGAVLNQLSAFWFKRFDKIDNHFVTADFDKFPKELQGFRDQLAGRSMIVKKTKPLAVECVVRGYLAGSGWKEYQKSQSVCGIKLPAGLQLASQLPEPIFTPSTKADEGHDENIDMNECRRILGDEIANRVKDLSLEIYSRGRDHAAKRGIIVADTKFEFGQSRREIALDRRMSHARFVALLAEGPIRGRSKSAQLRQTIRARLSRDTRLGQNSAGAKVAARSHRENIGQICRGVREVNRREIKVATPPQCRGNTLCNARLRRRRSISITRPS